MGRFSIRHVSKILKITLFLGATALVSCGIFDQKKKEEVVQVDASTHQPVYAPTASVPVPAASQDSKSVNSSKGPIATSDQDFEKAKPLMDSRSIPKQNSENTKLPNDSGPAPQPNIVQTKPGTEGSLMDFGTPDPNYCEAIPLRNIDHIYDTTDTQIIYPLKKGIRYPLVYMATFSGKVGSGIGIEVTRDDKDRGKKVHDKVILAEETNQFKVDCGDNNQTTITKNRILITDVAIDLYTLYGVGKSDPQCVLEVGNHFSFGGIATAPELVKKVISTEILFDAGIDGVSLIRELSGIKCQPSLRAIDIGPGGFYKENEIVFGLKVPSTPYSFKQRVLRN